MTPLMWFGRMDAVFFSVKFCWTPIKGNHCSGLILVCSCWLQDVVEYQQATCPIRDGSALCLSRAEDWWHTGKMIEGYVMYWLSDNETSGFEPGCLFDWRISWRCYAVVYRSTRAGRWMPASGAAGILYWQHSFRWCCLHVSQAAAVNLWSPSPYCF